MRYSRYYWAITLNNVKAEVFLQTQGLFQSKKWFLRAIRDILLKYSDMVEYLEYLLLIWNHLIFNHTFIYIMVHREDILAVLWYSLHLYFGPSADTTESTCSMLPYSWHQLFPGSRIGAFQH